MSSPTLAAASTSSFSASTVSSAAISMMDHEEESMSKGEMFLSDMPSSLDDTSTTGPPPSVTTTTTIITVHSLYRNDLVQHTALLDRITLRLLPFLLVLYTFSYIDRSNLSNVHKTMLADLKITEEQYGSAASIFFIPYVLLEVPSNMVLERVDARRWLARIIGTWGLISTAMVAVVNYEGLVIARLFLGIAEAGFFPGIIFYLTQWFTPKERAKRLALIFIAQPLAGILGGLLAYPILNYMHDFLGLAGWRWVMLCEGAPTVVLGVVTWFYLPATPRDAKWLTEEEQEYLIQRMKGLDAHGQEREAIPGVKDETISVVEDSSSPSSSSSSPRLYPAGSFTFATLRTRFLTFYALSRAELIHLYHTTFSNRIIWLCIIANFLTLLPVQAITFYLPSIVSEIGVGALTGNLISAIPYGCACICMYTLSVYSDRTGERTRLVLMCNAIGFLGLFVTAFVMSKESTDVGLIILQLLCLSISASGIWSCKPIFAAIYTTNLPGNLAVAIAAVTTFGNISGIVAPNIVSGLREASGNYVTACIFLMCCIALSAITIVFLDKEIKNVKRRQEEEKRRKVEVEMMESQQQQGGGESTSRSTSHSNGEQEESSRFFNNDRDFTAAAMTMLNDTSSPSAAGISDTSYSPVVDRDFTALNTPTSRRGTSTANGWHF